MIRNPVTIEPLGAENVQGARALTVKDFQVVFSGQPAEVLEGPIEGITNHVICKEGDPVGMFRVDTRYHFNHTFAQSDTPGIRTFVIDQAKQGQGLGTEACRMLRTYLPGVIPRARGVYMTVNFRNMGAYKAYTRGGWTDTGAEYTLGRAGPQHILWMPLR